ncbi:unnamed protein product [Adineta steineri]|uniref:Tetratricopeptide repeat protein n=1 Tax=Adineta steineri TaxID=433720 RepID=A0A819UL14_9BILA|nr:unnamed protein product [Adineta steineri]CAF4094049.1 unnamed protein product [Adineta steineri]
MELNKDNGSWIIHVTFKMGLVYMKWGRYDSAIRHFQGVLDYSSSIQSFPLEVIGTFHEHLAMAYEKQRKYKEALNHWEKLLEIQTKIFEPFSIEIADTYLSMAENYLMLLEFGRVIEMWHKVKSVHLNPLSPNYNAASFLFNQMENPDTSSPEYIRTLLLQLRSHSASVKLKAQPSYISEKTEL